MKLIKKYPILGSSKSPEQMSLTIKSVGVWLIPAIIAIGNIFSIELMQADLTQLINTLAVVIAGIMTIYGLGRKLYYRI